MNHELPDVQAGFRKGRETRDQIANIIWIIEKARKKIKKKKKQGISEKKKSSSASLTTLKPLTVWTTTNYGKFLKRQQHQTNYLSPEKPT